MIKLKKLIESPDYVFVPRLDHGVEYDDRDAYAFYYIGDRLYISHEPGITHDKIIMSRETRRQAYVGNITYGRIWTESKVVSFWRHPKNRKEMEQIADDISEHFELFHDIHIDVWNDFQVEVYDEYFKQYKNVPESGLIPVKSYKHSENPPEEERIRHLLSLAQKKDIEVTPGWGSKKRPAGLSATQRHRIKSTSENKI